MTPDEFAALEKRLADGVASGSATWSYSQDVLALLAECRALRAELERLRRPPDASGLMAAAALESLHRYVGSEEGRWLAPAVGHIDTQAALIRELYGVVADLHADDPGRQALLERGRAEGRAQVWEIVVEYGTPLTDGAISAEEFEARYGKGGLGDAVRALGPCRPPLPLSEAEREAGRLREALSVVVAARDGYDRYEVSLNEVYGTIDAAREALGEGA